MSARGPTWAQFAAWCSRHGFDAADARRNIEQHEAQLEADRWMAEIRRLADAGPHLTGAKWLENQRAFDIAMRAHEKAVKRAYG